MEGEAVMDTNQKRSRLEKCQDQERRIRHLCVAAVAMAVIFLGAFMRTIAVSHDRGLCFALLSAGLVFSAFAGALIAIKKRAEELVDDEPGSGY
jgi:uncharacterized membrane protein YqhA